MNPYWNRKITTENGQLRTTMGVVREVPLDLVPRRARVELYVFEGDGSKTQEAWLPILSTFVDDIDVENTVKVDFMGDTLESGVVMGRVDFF